MVTTFEWDDLRFFLALANGGTITDAAKHLQVSRSTVVRRCERLEELAKVDLFRRSADGILLTEAGKALLPLAEAMEERMTTAQRVLAGHELALAGPLSVTIFDLGAFLFAPAFAALAKAYPEIDLTVITSNQPFRLERREADIAIRASSAPDEQLFGRKVGRFEFAVYGIEALKQEGNPPWVLPHESLGAELTWDLARRRSQPLKVAARVDGLDPLVSWLREGMGVGLLPIQIARRFPGLVTIFDPLEEGLGMDVWVLAHPDLRKSAKVRTALRHFGETIPPLLAL